MIYIGIDIAKSKHYASAISSDGVVLVEPFAFYNSRKGFDFLLDNLNKLDFSDCLFGLEATGHYGDALVNFLFNKGFKIGIINPIQTNGLRTSNIRKTKTDSVDTILIAQALQMRYYTPFSAKDLSIIKIRTLSRLRSNLVKSRTKFKIQLVGCMDQLFPEYASLFYKGNIHIKSSYALLHKCSEPSKIAKMRTSTLAILLHKASKGHFSNEKALSIKTAAADSIGITNPALATQVTLSVDQIRLLDNQIETIEQELEALVNSTKSPIISIPGIAYVISSAIIGEIGDINKFSHPCKLLAYAGLDPTVKQSGNFNATNTQISKRGSSHLRYAIMKAASLIIYNNETFSNYYIMKRNQGKSHNNAVGHVAHKLTRVIYKLLKDNETFNLD